jgi:predicted RNA-binding protein with TRAM domain
LNNEASKAGAIYFTSWAGNVLFENCAFVGNVAKESFGGSALFIRTIATGSPAMNIVNCTFKGNHVNTTSNGGTINFGGRATNTTTVNIINSTISENTTAGSSANSAGIFMNNSDANLDGIFYIKNSIIEGNKNATGAPADLNISAISATSPGGTTGYMAIQNSIIGFVATPANIPAGNITASAHFNYLTSTSTTNDLKAGLAPFNTTTNSFSLYTSSAAIGYGNSSYLTGLTPTVTTDQLGNVRTVGATNYAGSVETTPLATTTPSAPTSIVATAGTGQISVAFKSGATGGSLITNYKYSLDGGTTFTACSPVDILTPIVITGVSNQAYTVILKAVNDNGDGIASAASNSVTPVTVPEAPTALVAASGNTQITISFTEGANGGSAITNYKYSIDGGATFTACDPAQTTGPIVITGLTNGTSYTVILKAVNQYGDGIASAESNSVVPSTSTALESTLNQAVTIYKNAENQVIINNSTQKAGSVSLVNAIGQHMLTRRINNNITMINQTVQPGVYMVIVNVDGNIFKNKIIL